MNADTLAGRITDGDILAVIVRAIAAGDDRGTILAQELATHIDSALLLRLAAQYAAITAGQKIQINQQQKSVDQLMTAAAEQLGDQAALHKLRLHRDSIRMMRRNLLRLSPWKWRRRRNIEHQLALIALGLVD